MAITLSDLVLDREQLRTATLEDPTLMRRILEALIEDTGRQSDLLETALRERDATRAIRLARYSARACDDVGALRAAGVLRSIERAAAAADAPSGAAAIASLRAELSRLQSEAIEM